MEEQKVRAGGEQKGAQPDTIRENGDRAIADAHPTDGEHKPPQADEAAVSDALKRELKEVEQEEKERRESHKAQDELAGSVAIQQQRQPATPTAALNTRDTADASTLSSPSPCIPVDLHTALPNLTITAPPVTATVVAPPVAVYGEGFDVRLVLRNASGGTLDVEWSVRGGGVGSEGGDGGGKVLVGGVLAGVCRLFPHSVQELQWSALSLETGFVLLPALSVQLLPNETGQQPTVLVNPDEVGSIFVRTRAKREQPHTTSS